MSKFVGLATLLFQGGIVVAVLAGLHQWNLAAVVNAAAAFVVALLPAAAEVVARTGLGVALALPVELSLWVAAAGFLHAVGMLGLYEAGVGWDHLTHTLSAALAAVVSHAAVLVAADATGIALPDPLLAGVTLLLVFLLGVYWELLEVVARDVGEARGIEPVLVIYGPRDTVLDLVFNLVGAVAGLLLTPRLFLDVAERYPEATTTLLGLVVGAVALSTPLLLVYVGLDGLVPERRGDER